MSYRLRDLFDCVTVNWFIIYLLEISTNGFLWIDQSVDSQAHRTPVSAEMDGYAIEGSGEIRAMEGYTCMKPPGPGMDGTLDSADALAMVSATSPFHVFTVSAKRVRLVMAFSTSRRSSQLYFWRCR